MEIINQIFLLNVFFNLFMFQFKDTTANNLFIQIAQTLLKDGIIIAPRGLKTIELYNVWINLTHPNNCLVTLKERCIDQNYLNGEMEWYLSGDLNVNGIGKYSKFWFNICNLDGTVNSNYGFFVFKQIMPNNKSQFEWCVQSILKDPNTRQAVINYNQPIHKYEDNKDFVCTMSQHFKQHDGVIDTTVIMRSNDLIYGLTYDINWFVYVLSQLCKSTGYQMGQYYQFTSSLHVYEKHLDMLNSISHAQIDPNGQLKAKIIHVFNKALLTRIEIFEQWSIENPDLKHSNFDLVNKSSLMCLPYLVYALDQDISKTSNKIDCYSYLFQMVKENVDKYGRMASWGTIELLFPFALSCYYNLLNHNQKDEWIYFKDFLLNTTIQDVEMLNQSRICAWQCSSKIEKRNYRKRDVEDKDPLIGIVEGNTIYEHYQLLEDYGNINNYDFISNWSNQIINRLSIASEIYQNLFNNRDITLSNVICDLWKKKLQLNSKIKIGQLIDYTTVALFLYFFKLNC